MLTGRQVIGTMMDSFLFTGCRKTTTVRGRANKRKELRLVTFMVTSSTHILTSS